MAVIDLSDVAYAWPGGWTLFEGVTDLAQLTVALRQIRALVS